MSLSGSDQSKLWVGIISGNVGDFKTIIDLLLNEDQSSPQKHLAVRMYRNSKEGVVILRRIVKTGGSHCNVLY